MNRSDIGRTIEAVWRMESARIIAKLARMLRDVGLAEEIAQDAWLAALEQWSEGGLPDNPAAWLMTTAKNRAIDQLRRRQLLERKKRCHGSRPRFTWHSKYDGGPGHRGRRCVG